MNTKFLDGLAPTLWLAGIGAACSRLFAQHGARVVVADLQKDKGSSLASELGSEQALFVPCDVTKEGDVAAAVQVRNQGLPQPRRHPGCARVSAGQDVPSPLAKALCRSRG